MEYELTQTEIDEIEDVGIDKKSNDETLEIALEYYSNALSDILRREVRWWDKMAEKYGFEKKDYWMNCGTACCTPKRQEWMSWWYI